MPVYQADALVIRSREYGESDRLLTLFSREYGKLQAIAKGVRKPKSRQRAGVQLFTYADYLLHKGRTLDIVNEAGPRESFPHLWNDFEKSVAASGVAELLDVATLPGQAHPELFTLTLTVFFLLEHYPPFLMKNAYALRLLHILGYHPRLAECAECGAKVEGSRVFFSPAAGGVLCSRCKGEYSGRWAGAGSLAFMRQLLFGDLAKLDRLRWNSSLQEEVSELTGLYCEEKFERRLRAWQTVNLAPGPEETEPQAGGQQNIRLTDWKPQADGKEGRHDEHRALDRVGKDRYSPGTNGLKL